MNYLYHAFSNCTVIMSFIIINNSSLAYHHVFTCTNMYFSETKAVQKNWAGNQSLVNFTSFPTRPPEIQEPIMEGDCATNNYIKLDVLKQHRTLFVVFRTPPFLFSYNNFLVVLCYIFCMPILDLSTFISLYDKILKTIVLLVLYKIK